MTVGLSRVVDAERTRVWRSLAGGRGETAPSAGGTAADPAAERSRRSARTLRLRFELRHLPVTLLEVPAAACPPERLRARVRLGPVCFEATFTLAALDRDRTRVTLSLAAPNELWVAGELLDRFAVRRLATDLAAGALAALGTRCEGRRVAVRTAP